MNRNHGNPAIINILLLVTMSALVLPFSGCKSQEITCHWAQKKLIVDGDADDWKSYPATFFEKNNAALGLASDNENLYLLFRFQDPQLARTIRMTGLTLYLDPGGGKSKDFGVRYSGGLSFEEMRKNRGGEERGQMSRKNDDQRMKDMAQREERTQKFLTILNSEWLYDSLTVPVTGENGPKIAFAQSGGFYIYEFSIPLKNNEENDMYGLGMKPGDTIGLGAIWGEMNRNGSQRPGGPPGGGGGGMGGPPGGGGMRGGGNNMPEKQEIWLKSILAQIADKEIHPLPSAF